MVLPESIPVPRTATKGLLIVSKSFFTTIKSFIFNGLFNFPTTDPNNSHSVAEPIKTLWSLLRPITPPKFNKLILSNLFNSSGT